MSKYLSLSSITADNAVGLELQGNRSGSDQTVARLSFINGSSETARITIDSSSGGANSNMIFATGGTTERLRITTGGNVNIGGNYSQSTYTSQITGTLNVTGNITQNGATLATTGKAIAMAMVFG